MRSVRRIPLGRVRTLTSDLTGEAYRCRLGSPAGRLERTVLERIARGDRLDLVLDTLVHLLEARLHPVRALLGVVDETGGTVRVVRAPGLPPGLVQLLDGQPVDAVSFSGGATVYHRALVPTESARDAQSASKGPGACRCGMWSSPIFARSGEVLGTVGLLYETPREPNGRERRSVALAAHLAGIAMESHREQQALRAAQERFIQFFQDSPVPISITAVADGCYIEVNAAWLRLVGLQREQVVGRTAAELGLCCEIVLERLDLGGESCVVSVLGDVAAHKGRQPARHQQPDPEDRLRRVAEAQEQRLSFVTAAGALLASSPDYKRAFRELANLTIPYLADWCRVVAFDGEGELLAEAHRDPARLAELNAVRPLLPLDEDQASPFNTLQHTGQSVLIPAVADAAQAGGAAIRRLHQRGVRSYMAVPIRGRDRLLGAIAFGREDDSRYGPAELLLAQDIARRAAAAIDNALLCAAEQEAVRARDWTLDRLELEHGLLDSLFTHAPIAVAILRGRDHVFALTNPYFSKLVGGRQVVGKPLRVALPEVADQGLLADLERCVVTGEPLSAREARVLVDRNGDGGLEELWLNRVCYPTRGPDGRVDGILFYALDVTAAIEGRRQVESKTAQIQQMNADLERRVSERTAQLQETNRELESFSYTVSHDLRAPLGAIGGYSQALLDEFGGRLDGSGESHLQRVRMASQRMAHLIDALLNLFRLSSSNMEVRQLDLSSMADSIVQDLRSADPERAVTCVIAPDVMAYGDAALVKVALENLLGNAWKFTARRAQAQIEFGAVGADGRRVFFVRDNGAGFDMAHADMLFGAFQRLHSPDEFEGTGIGLATVQRVIHRHGGIIWADAKVDRGATFYFTLGNRDFAD